MTRQQAGQYRFQISVGERDLYPLQVMQTGYEVHPTSYSLITRLFPRGKVAMAWSWLLASISCRG